MKKILICVQSIDGKIARGKDDPIDWTSKEDRKFFATETKKARVVIMGSNTHESIGKVLPERLNIVLTTKKENKSFEKGVLEFTHQAPREIVNELEKRKYKKVFIIGGSTINSLFLVNKLVDEIWLTIEGVILGKGISLFDDGRYGFRAKLLTSKRIGDSGIFLKYKIIY